MLSLPGAGTLWTLSDSENFLTVAPMKQRHVDRHATPNSLILQNQETLSISYTAMPSRILLL